MKKAFYAFLSVALGIFSPMAAQDIIAIADIQGIAEKSPYEGQEVSTQGIVTLTLFGDGQLKGFFMQDTSDTKPEASSGIFVYGTPSVEIRQGDFLHLTGKVSEWYGRTQLSQYRFEILRRDMPIRYKTVNFPEDLSSPADFERHEGMALRIAHPMYLTSNYQVQSDASVELSSKRLRSPTDYNMPGSDAYRRALDSNRLNRLVLDDGSNTRYPASNPWLDADGTCRTGQKIDSLLLVVDQSDERYKVYAVEKPVFYGNERTVAPDEAVLGDYELKVCGFNLERYYDKEPLQRERLVAALSAIDADMFGLVEVGGGKKVIDSLVAALNRKTSDPYTYLNWNGYQAVSDYTLNHIVYRPSKVEPYDQYFMLNNVGPTNRKLIQAFKELKHGQKFIFSINHFKAKSGTGTGADADQGDGQGVFNNRRLQEAYAVQDRLNSLKFYYNTERVLIMGDLNAMYFEDPIRVFTDAGYRNQTHRFGENYTYCFDGQVQYLDYSLASPQMEEAVTGATVWHINSDEPSFWDFDRDTEHHAGPYRSSDHEPVIVGLNFASAKNLSNAESSITLYPNPARDFFTLEMPATGKVEIHTMGGVLVKTLNLPAGKNPVNLENLRPGLYFVRVSVANEYVRTTKLLIL